MGYDPKKAAAFNKLRQAGVSEDQALSQAGISDADLGNYALGSNGQLGALNIGGGKVAGVDYEKLSPAELREQARFDQGLKSVDYDEKADAPPKPTTPITYTTTSTETVSGGGSTTIVAGPRQSNANSQALGSAYDAKNAEYNQFVKDNPSDFARRRQGLPPLTPEEAQQRQARLDQLNQEKESLKNRQIDAETPGTPTVITTPNTTTTTTTVTSGRVAPSEPVNIQNDPAVFNQAERQLENQTPQAATVNTVRAPTEVDTAPAEVTVVQEPAAFQPQSVEPQEDPFEAERLAAEQRLADETPVLTAEDVPPIDPEVQAQIEREQELNRTNLAIEAFEPEPVNEDLNLDESPAETARLRSFADSAGESADNESAAETARLNRQESETKAKLAEAQQQATIQQRFNQTTNSDWRVRLRIAPDADYLYQDRTNTLLAPLKVSDGVVFPYTPTINTNYAAKYDAYDLTHSNYRGYFYRGSQVSDINIQATFTAQDTREAEYVLAVIHFFRSATKMFYGQDKQRGAPPPLVYLRGYGEYQFNDHACVISNFQYNLPNDVDYIAITPNNVGLNLSNRQAQVGSSPVSTISSAINRLGNLFNVASGQPGVPRGAKPGQRSDVGVTRQTVNGTGQTTFVPTKIDLSITLLPVQTRSQVSKQFSAKEFANGSLLKKGFW